MLHAPCNAGWCLLTMQGIESVDAEVSVVQQRLEELQELREAKLKASSPTRQA